MTYSPWSIVTVPFPFTDKEKTKKRPALVISTTSFAAAHQHHVLLMITTAKDSSWQSDIRINNIDSTGLPVPCVIRFKAFTLDSQLILDRIGQLNAADCQRVLAALPSVLASEV